MEVLMRNPDFQASVNGVVVVADVGSADAATVKHFTPAFGKKVVTVYQDGYPARPKELHIINLHPVIEGICRVLMAFAKKKLRDRTKFHSKSDKLSRLYDAL